MNKKIKDLTLTSMFLAMAAVLCILQIPIINGVSFDIAFIPLLLSRWYVGLTKTIIICFLYPWFSLLGIAGSLPGVLFLIMQSLALVFCDFLLNRKKYNILGIIISITIVTLFSILINVFIIAPMFVPNYYDSFSENASAWALFSLVYNPFKLVIIYSITWPTYFALDKVIN